MAKLEKKVNVDKKIVDLEGNPIPRIDISKDEKGNPIIYADGTFKTFSKGDKTVKDCILEVLNQPYDSKEITLESLLDRGRIIKEVQKGGEVALESKYLDIVKSLLPKGRLTPDEVFQVYELLF